MFYKTIVGKGVISLALCKGAFDVYIHDKVIERYGYFYGPSLKNIIVFKRRMILKEMECRESKRLFVLAKAGPIYHVRDNVKNGDPGILEYKDFIDDQNSILIKRPLYGLGDYFYECQLLLTSEYEDGETILKAPLKRDKNGNWSPWTDERLMDKLSHVTRLSIPSRNCYSNYRLCISKIVDFINIFVS